MNVLSTIVILSLWFASIFLPFFISPYTRHIEDERHRERTKKDKNKYHFLKQ